MWKLGLLAFVVSLAACKPKADKVYPIPSKGEIDSVVEAVIVQDSLPVFKNDKNARYLASVLRKVHVIKWDTTKLYPPPFSFDSLYLGKKIISQFFKKKDLDYFIFQNQLIPRFAINDSVFKKLNINSRQQFEEEKKRHRLILYYEITIPLFSEDKKTAFLQINFHCFDCGEGWDIVLKKINGKWLIVRREGTWMN